MKVTLQDIEKARDRLRGFVHPTGTDLSQNASRVVGCEVYFKHENLQRTGSFKIRGAFNRVMTLTEAEKKRGVVASSAGNHAQGVALSARLAGVKATIVMPETASLNKISATKSYGAEVILKGEAYDEAFEYACRLEKETGAVFVHPYEDEDVIAGQGTIGLEILHAVPDLDSVIIPIGGGGLIAGVSTAIKAIRPSCRVIGVQATRAPGMSFLFRGESYQAPRGGVGSIADGISVKKPSLTMLNDFIKKTVDEIVTVSDDEIAEAMVYLLERTKNLVEGSGAAAAAAIFNRDLQLGKKTCILLSGGNIDLNVIAKVVERGLISQGRLMEISVIVDDQPGSLSRLTKIFADNKANILEVRHDRVERGLSLREAKVDFVLETTGPDHAEQIRSAIQSTGARILAERPTAGLP